MDIGANREVELWKSHFYHFEDSYTTKVLGELDIYEGTEDDCDLCDRQIFDNKYGCFDYEKEVILLCISKIKQKNKDNISFF